MPFAGRPSIERRPSSRPPAPVSPEVVAPDEELDEAPAAAEPAAAERPSDWGSLLADLSRPTEEGPQLRVHDRTHLEISLDYDLERAAEQASWEWEAYFFAPESLRLDSQTYDKQDVYEDLQSYVRLAVPEARFADLCGAPLDRVRASIERGDDKAAIRDMRIFACQVRSAGVTAKRNALARLHSGDALRAANEARAMVAEARRIGKRTREVLALAEGKSDTLLTASEWTEEDVSRLLETLLGNLVRELERSCAPDDVIELAREGAVAEARERVKAGLDGVGRVGMPASEAEHLEFRRHVLKRFTSSVLWLKAEVRPASEWVLHLLYGIAASVAMAFATVAALWNGAEMSGNVMRWTIVVIIAYAAKDRMKAMLQTLFAGVVSRHFPDRSWRIRDREKNATLGEMKEQSGFVPFAQLPEDVLTCRRSTRRHALEEEARPETVLFHKKKISLKKKSLQAIDPRYDAVTEILRLDLRRWLVHTDDPKREFVFADPDSGEIGSAVAPRVYNLAVVYRLKQTGAEAAWRRARVVVTRKGIRRIEPIV